MTKTYRRRSRWAAASVAVLAVAASSACASSHTTTPAAGRDYTVTVMTTGGPIIETIAFADGRTATRTGADAAGTFRDVVRLDVAVAAGNAAGATCAITSGNTTVDTEHVTGAHALVLCQAPALTSGG